MPEDANRRPSAIRRGLLWWFQPPAMPYLSTSFVVDITEARAYLRRCSALAGRKITLQHLVAAAVIDVQRTFPMANARIVGRRIVRETQIGLAMPVSLLESGAPSQRELSMAVLTQAEGLSLVALAEASDRLFAAERSDRVGNPVFRALLSAFDHLPDGPLWAGLDLVEGLRKVPAVADRLYAMVPATTGVTNPGAAVRMPPGIWLRGGALALPQRLGHVGSVWGVLPVQDEVVPHAGQPTVRPVLPIVYVFDHRLFDGVMAGRILHHFGQILLDPAAVLGEAGQRSPSS